MKSSALISVLFLCFVFVACVSEEEGCVTSSDCSEGYSCIDSVCRAADADSDSSSNNDSDSGLSDENTLPGDGDDAGELPDDISGCPNACSGFGTCNFETGTCTCDEQHQGADCSECLAGYHQEAEDYDEDGNPDIHSCVPNKKCTDDPHPCNGEACLTKGDTVECTCSGNLAGKWCDECKEGFIKSNVDGKCKPDCSKKSCTAPQKCGIDYTTNEAVCSECENEHYSGEGCKSCDAAYFCNGHGSSCVVEGDTEKCTCEALYTGTKCDSCIDGYFMSNGVCTKACDTDTCFKSRSCSGILGATVTGSAVGHGTCNATGGCDCDPGWVTGTSSNGKGTDVSCTLADVEIAVLNNIECALCDVNNPPQQYATSGCPVECPTNNFCDTYIIFLGFSGYGTCYREPAGEHKLYCVCASGYHLDNGDKYTGSCVADEEESGE